MTTFWGIILGIGLYYIYDEVKELRKAQEKALGNDVALMNTLKKHCGETLLIELRFVDFGLKYTSKGYVSAKIISIDADWIEFESLDHQKNTCITAIRQSDIKSIHKS